MKTKFNLFVLFVALLAAQGCDKADDILDEADQVDLPDNLEGATYDMVFSHANTGAPYELHQAVTFTFSSSGALFLDTNPDAGDGEEVEMQDVHESNGEYIWTDTQTGHQYALSLTTELEINEINLSDASDTFLGQFTLSQGEGGVDVSLIQGLASTYSVTTVKKGEHDRMTVVIDSEGNIDFDSDIQLSIADYAAVWDRRECCQGIWVDLSPYPSEPYRRVELFLDPESGTLSEVAFKPEYPGSNGIVVSFVE